MMLETVAHLGITLVNKENCIGIELYISDDKSIFDSLYAEKDSIEKELGLALDWQRLDGKKASRIVYRIPGLDFDDHSNYDTLMNEAIDKIIDFSKVFKKYMKWISVEDGGSMTNEEKIKKFRLSLIIQERKEFIMDCLKIWVTLRVTIRITWQQNRSNVMKNCSE